MHLQDALSLICGEICLQVTPVIAQATQAVKIVPGKITDASLTTWLVHGTHMFTIIKQGAYTLVFCHENNTLFYAKPDFMLSSSTPDGHAFLAQLAEDREGERTVPRLLIMDLVSPRIAEPARRQETMRALPGVFPSQCVLQWAGNEKALRKFLQGGLPHPVAGVIALCGPLHIVRELQVTLPGGVPSIRHEARADENPGAAKRSRVA